MDKKKGVMIIFVMIILFTLFIGIQSIFKYSETNIITGSFVGAPHSTFSYNPLIIISVLIGLISAYFYKFRDYLK